MEKLIDINNKLQEVLCIPGLHEFELPQIVVVGSQSSGKSSVLEHLVGRSFLPRGAGIVTRCPLVLQLTNSSDSGKANDYAMFSHTKAERFTDYNQITKEIEDETERLAGENKGICEKPIYLKMFSTSFTNLTLVDLPGLTKVPVGDQPEDIEQQTKQLILQYIKNPNSIILAVIPANADMATCESLKIAREVDPEGARTLAVVTKIDLMDEGTDAVEMLSGNIIPVKLGIIGVVNRSQKGILENKTMKQSLDDEKAFFKKKYKGLESIHGTPYLIKTIQSLLIRKIQQYLPDLKLKIIETLRMEGLKLHNLEKLNPDNPNLLMDIIFKFSNNFCAKINGKSDKIITTELNGGASIYKVFMDTNAILEEFNPIDDMSKDDILIAIKNAHGINVTCYIPKEAFELLVKQLIKQLHSPCLKCVDLVHKELIKIIDQCVNDPEMELQRYPILHKELRERALALLESHLQTTKEMVDNTVEPHLALINYNHPEFLKSRLQYLPPDHLNDTSKNVPGSQEKVIPKPNDEVYSEIVKSVESYFFIVKSSVKDMLPKLIMHSMVTKFMECLQSELMSELYSIKDSGLLAESEDFVQIKDKLKTYISVLEEAITILNSLNSPNCTSSRSLNNISSPEIQSLQGTPLPADEMLSSSSNDRDKKWQYEQIKTWLFSNDSFKISICTVIFAAVILGLLLRINE